MLACVNGGIVTTDNVDKRVLNAYTYKIPVYGSPYPKVIRTYRKVNNTYVFPRNLLKFKELTNCKYTYDTTLGVPIVANFNTGISLRSYQQTDLIKIIDYFKADVNVLFHAPTRYGKNFIILGIIAHYKVNTIILVDKTLLVDQLIKEAKEFTNISIGKVGSDADVIVMTFQYAHRNNISMATGLCIIDEVHCITAKTYTDVLMRLPADKRLGVTATPTAGRLSSVIYDQVGDVKLVGHNPNNIQVRLINHHLPRTYDPFHMSTPKESYDEYFTSTLVTNSVMELIVDSLGKNILIATPSQVVQNHYATLVEKLGIRCDIFNSEYGNKRLQSYNLELLNSGAGMIFTGFGVMMKGVSVVLDVIIGLAPAGGEEALQQLVGRAKTPYEGKIEPVYINCVSKYLTRKDRRVISILNKLDDIIVEEVTKC